MHNIFHDFHDLPLTSIVNILESLIFTYFIFVLLYHFCLKTWCTLYIWYRFRDIIWWNWYLIVSIQFLTINQSTTSTHQSVCPDLDHNRFSSWNNTYAVIKIINHDFIHKSCRSRSPPPNYATHMYSILWRCTSMILAKAVNC